MARGRAEPIRHMLHSAVFLIVEMLRTSGAETLGLQGTFLDASRRLALQPQRPSDRTRHGRRSSRLARLTIRSGDAVPPPARQRSGSSRGTLETRLVVREGRSLRFASAGSGAILRRPAAPGERTRRTRPRRPIGTGPLARHPDARGDHRLMAPSQRFARQPVGPVSGLGFLHRGKCSPATDHSVEYRTAEPRRVRAAHPPCPGCLGRCARPHQQTPQRH